MEKTVTIEKEEASVSFLAKMAGKGRSPLQVNVKDALTGLVGGFCSIFALFLLTTATSTLWIMAPFGASCVLAFGLWNAPLSQPRNIIGGHLVSTFIGLLGYHLFGHAPWVMGLGVGLAIAVMMVTKTTHPPAGADPLVVIMAGSSWSYLVTPVLVGAIIIVLFALIINNVRRERQYPTFWL
ncbi:membrane protein [Pullulanibacillus camelliae]|uniref:Membrane protein n=1 Tax=Pullulanibacillus camelliae TaxID=1707096 RepID=A0A8J2YG09_9BACL|nr:HPP family protein [Pullulanibacillus camelliae]GGE32848.1 membrane protein [Pullulanibacillus camelliae]